MDLRAIRQEYKKQELSLQDLDTNPFEQFKNWFEQATKDLNDEPNAFCLSTVDTNGQADARIVLLKELADSRFLFFTNYLSQKGQQMAENPKVSALFFWSKSEKQVRIKGTVEKCNEEVSDQYFYSRPAGSQAGAIASQQSSIIDANKDELINTFEELKDQTTLKRPEHWGGYYLLAHEIEFWQGGKNRMHDRFRYTKTNGSWKIERLAP
jgi:pyridoxamine 5'-phosphate oxidase